MAQSKTKRSATVTCIIACEVFRSALDYLDLEHRYPRLRITYLPGRLHLRPPELRKRLLREVRKVQKRGERAVCLYGDCFPGMAEYCKQHGIKKVPGLSCYEMFLGRRRFKQHLNKVTGTYFLEERIITNFDDYCMKPLELQDEEMRDLCFHHYERLLYVRQPSDPDLMSRAGELAKFLGLSLEVDDADYSYIEKELLKLL
jgi:hypothetical protein